MAMILRPVATFSSCATLDSSLGSWLSIASYNNGNNNIYLSITEVINSTTVYMREICKLHNIGNIIVLCQFYALVKSEQTWRKADAVWEYWITIVSP